MAIFKNGDKVVFRGNYNRGEEYYRQYYPILGEIGVIVKKNACMGRNEYLVKFGSEENWTYCNGKEIELLNEYSTTLDVNSLYPQVITCDDSRGYGKSATEEVVIVETKIEYLQKEIEKLKKKMEEKEMKNEVLELWYTRSISQISKEYDEKEIEFNESKELVVKYNDIVDRFENELKELYESEENVENNYIRDALSSGSMYKYKINYDKLRDEFIEKYISERNEKINELDELKREIDAQLSLSTDSEYQIDVLIRYGVLDKKTKKMVN